MKFPKRDKRNTQEKERLPEGTSSEVENASRSPEDESAPPAIPPVAQNRQMRTETVITFSPFFSGR